MKEQQKVHLEEVIKEVEKLIQSTATMDPLIKYVYYDVPFFSTSLTSFAADYPDLVCQLVRHFRRQGFRCVAYPKDPELGARSALVICVSWSV